jgi:hypothetical protein
MSEHGFIFRAISFIIFLSFLSDAPYDYHPQSVTEEQAKPLS